MKSIALFIILLSTQTLFAQGKNFIDQPYIEANGSVDTLVTPDMIFLDILITEKDSKNRVSIEQLENKMTAALQKLDIDIKKYLTVDDLSSNFKRSFLSGQEIYKTKRFLLELQTAQKAGDVVQALEKIEISNVQLSHAEYSKIDELNLKLKVLAVKQAKVEADALSGALGQKTGAAIFISENSNQYTMRGSRSDMMSIQSIKMSTDVEIEIQKIKVECQINVKFKLLEE
ncbi:MAG: hypothetical protein ACI9XP_001966 [Lentimonas sp.]|jgi:uncharacterized protein YggE